MRIPDHIDCYSLLALAPERHNQFAQAVPELCEHRLRTEPRICQYLPGVLTQVGLYGGQQHGQAVAVGRIVSEFGCNHDLRRFVHCGVGVEAVVMTTARAFHDAAVRVSEAFLGTVFGNTEVRLE